MSVVLDLLSRQVIGWSKGSRIDRELAINALMMAVWRRRPKGAVLAHSDQGCQGGLNRSSQHTQRSRNFHGTTSGVDASVDGGSAMRSPGASSLRREIERLFWKQIATGVTSERAAEAVGVSQPAGTRWFRYRGGMPLSLSSPVSGRYPSFAERAEIGLLSAQGVSVRQIARRIERSPSTASRELTRNAATRGGRLEYRASVAQWQSESVAERPKPSKLVTNARLRHCLQDRLSTESEVRWYVEALGLLGGKHAPDPLGGGQR